MPKDEGVASPEGDLELELLQPRQCDLGTLRFLKIHWHKELHCFVIYFCLDSSAKFGQPLEQWLEALTPDRVQMVDIITTRMEIDIAKGYICPGEAQLRALLDRKVLDSNCALLVAINLMDAIAVVLSGLPEEIRADLSTNWLDKAEENCKTFASTGISGEPDSEEHYF
jgi:hypothetical protein